MPAQLETEVPRVAAPRQAARRAEEGASAAEDPEEWAAAGDPEGWAAAQGPEELPGAEGPRQVPARPHLRRPEVPAVHPGMPGPPFQSKRIAHGGTTQDPSAERPPAASMRSG